MKPFFLLFLLSTSLFAKDWSLTDASAGWNTNDLVRLYYHNSDLQTEWSLKALSHYKFTGNENVLDFGCGDGKISALLSTYVPEGSVTGIDISKQMLAFANKKFPKKTWENLSFQTSEDINFEKSDFSKKFDVVTSFCVMHIVPAPKSILKNIREVMKDGGKLILSFPVGKNSDFFRAADEEMKLRGWSYPNATAETKDIRNPSKVKDIFKEAGFKLDYFEVITSKYPFSTKGEFVDWLEGTMTANWNIPQEARRAFFENLADRYLSYRKDEQDEDGFVYFTLDRIDLVATK